MEKWMAGSGFFKRVTSRLREGERLSFKITDKGPSCLGPVVLYLEYQVGTYRATIEAVGAIAPEIPSLKWSLGVIEGNCYNKSLACAICQAMETARFTPICTLEMWYGSRDSTYIDFWYHSELKIIESFLQDKKNISFFPWLFITDNQELNRQVDAHRKELPIPLVFSLSHKCELRMTEGQAPLFRLEITGRVITCEYTEKRLAFQGASKGFVLLESVGKARSYSLAVAMDWAILLRGLYSPIGVGGLGSQIIRSRQRRNRHVLR